MPMVNLDIRLMRKRLAPEKDAGPVTPSVTRTRCKSGAILIYGGMIVKADIRSRSAPAANFLLLFTIRYIRHTGLLTNVRLSHFSHPESTSQTTHFCSRRFSANFRFQEDRHVENYFPSDVRDLVCSAVCEPLCGLRVWPSIRPRASAAMGTKSLPPLLPHPFTAKNGCNSCHIQLTDLSKHVKGEIKVEKVRCERCHKRGKRRALCQCA